MRVIKDGKVDYKEYAFICIHCECEFVADNKDRKADQREGDYVVCPCCGSWIDWNCGNYINK
jgi:DNA-directed RNA polymerase subunit RPC12/RpoP